MFKLPQRLVNHKFIQFHSFISFSLIKQRVNYIKRLLPDGIESITDCLSDSKKLDKNSKRIC